jgi:uncharacterized protein YbaA (DUF1428 family)
MAYVDGFVVPLPRDKIDAYRFNSRAERDAINDKVMKDPRLAEFMQPGAMPFDGKRMIYGGFESLVAL